MSLVPFILSHWYSQLFTDMKDGGEYWEILEIIYFDIMFAKLKMEKINQEEIKHTWMFVELMRDKIIEVS